MMEYSIEMAGVSKAPLEGYGFYGAADPQQLICSLMQAMAKGEVGETHSHQILEMTAENVAAHPAQCRRLRYRHIALALKHQVYRRIDSPE